MRFIETNQTKPDESIPLTVVGVMHFGFQVPEEVVSELVGIFEAATNQRARQQRVVIRLVFQNLIFKSRERERERTIEVKSIMYFF